ncbi:MAG: peptidoglycan DD-metalloendopeptidase family protein [Flavisolibacter sp.]|jgi:septal ring factor EnvC (AmiA/AmiB activator)|nr:peptidoglycan DD-metalloendopeptidase family protein [Flavisolibacter sp.]
MKKTAILLIIFLASIGVFAQDRDKMERDRAALQKELKEIQSVYNKVKGETRVNLGQLNLLQKKMAVQNKYINNINGEIKHLNNDIYLSTLELNRMQKQLDTLKTQYSRSVVYAYKTKSTYDYLNFIFSANDFNDALKRVAYLRTYRVYRQQQVENILQTQKEIELRKQQLLGKKNQKSSALSNQTHQMKELEDQKKEKDVVVNKLKSKEKELGKQIADRKKKDAQLKNSIAAIIRREIEARKKAEEEENKRLAAIEKARTTSTTASSSTASAPAASPAKTRTTTSAANIPLNEKEVILSNSFASNRGKLPHPVDNGYVSIPFGPYKVPGTSLSGDNPGLTYTTPSPGATVKSVFDGEVLSVFNLGDGTQAVTITHGKYFTTYSNLSGVSVGKGSSVKTGQAIGRAAADDEGGSGGKVDFILMVEMKNVNPGLWLRR